MRHAHFRLPYLTGDKCMASSMMNCSLVFGATKAKSIIARSAVANAENQNQNSTCMFSCYAMYNMHLHVLI